MFVLIGSSTSVPNATFAIRLREALGVTALGISGASVASWIRKVTGEGANTYSGKDVLVYLPGQLDVPSSTSIQRLHDLLKQKGAQTVRWILPPVFPGDRETITGGTANAILRAGVPVVSRTRLVLSAADVTADNVHLKAPAQARLAAQVVQGLAGVTTSPPPTPETPPVRVPPATLVTSSVQVGAGIGVLLAGALALGVVYYLVQER